MSFWFAVPVAVAILWTFWETRMAEIRSRQRIDGLALTYAGHRRAIEDLRSEVAELSASERINSKSIDAIRECEANVLKFKTIIPRSFEEPEPGEHEVN